jgi:hypothetical protein
VISTPSKTASLPRNTFQASQGGIRVVQASNVPTEVEGTEKPEISDLSLKEGADEPEKGPEGELLQQAAIPVEETQAVTPAPKTNGRILFIYTCPSASPIKFRMVYSSGVRGMQQDAMDKAGIDISVKVSLWCTICAWCSANLRSWRHLTYWISPKHTSNPPSLPSPPIHPRCRPLPMLVAALSPARSLVGLVLEQEEHLDLLCRLQE